MNAFHSPHQAIALLEVKDGIIVIAVIIIIINFFFYKNAPLEQNE